MQKIKNLILILISSLVIILSPARSAEEPKIIAALSSNTAHIQQVLIYSVKIISKETLSILKFKSPKISNGSIEYLDGPRIYKQVKLGISYNVIEYRYTITPLSVGELTIQNSVANVKYMQNKVQSQQWNYTNPYHHNQWQQKKLTSVSITKELRSELISIIIKPPMFTDKAWLPLHNLQLKGLLNTNEQLTEGEPISYQIIITATGVKAEYLPTLLPLLKSDDFKIYFESSNNNQSITNDDSNIISQRLAQFTLVPKKSGHLQLPTLRLHWWNLLSNKETWSEIPLSTVFVSQAEETLIEDINTQQTMDNNYHELLSYIGLVFASAFIFLAGLWIGSGKPGTDKIKLQTKKLQRFSYRSFRKILAPAIHLKTRLPEYKIGLSAISNRTYLELFISRHEQRLPLPLKLIWINYLLKRAEKIDELYQILGKLSSLCLHLPKTTPLQKLANQLCLNYTALNSSNVRTLLKQMEQAKFDQQKFNIEDWKTKFMAEIKWLPIYQQSKNESTEKQGLPFLNP